MGAMSRSRWPRSPSHGICSPTFSGSSRNFDRRQSHQQRKAFVNSVKHSFVMRRVKLKGGLCPNDGKNIAPRHRPLLRRQRRAKSRLPLGNPGYTPHPLTRGRGGSGFVTINSGDAGSTSSSSGGCRFNRRLSGEFGSHVGGVPAYREGQFPPISLSNPRSPGDVS
jgi:hypothetical protein